MAQFDFYGTWSDSWALLEIIVKHEWLIFSDLWYKNEDDVICFNEINDELKEILHRRPCLFIWGKEFSIFKLHLVMQQTGPRRGEYRLGAEYGGPCLDLTLPRCLEDNHKITATPSGMLSYPQSFKNPETGEWLKPNHEIKDAYSTVLKEFKKVLKKVTLTKNLWIGEGALILLDKGENEIIVDGKQLKWEARGIEE